MAVKVLINKGFWICILGQMIAAIGQPFVLNSPAKLACVWFGEHERILALTLAVASQAIGGAVGFVIPTLFVT